MWEAANILARHSRPDEVREALKSRPASPGTSATTAPPGAGKAPPPSAKLQYQQDGRERALGAGPAKGVVAAAAAAAQAARRQRPALRRSLSDQIGSLGVDQQPALAGADAEAAGAQLRDDAAALGGVDQAASGGEGGGGAAPGPASPGLARMRSLSAPKQLNEQGDDALS
jgi:hypothetical protein